jgi:hypothetical protein
LDRVAGTAAAVAASDPRNWRLLAGILGMAVSFHEKEMKMKDQLQFTILGTRAGVNLA